jgi:hypothetical protein
LLRILLGERIPFIYGKNQNPEFRDDGKLEAKKKPIFVEFVDIELLRSEVAEWSWAQKV